MRSNPVLEQPLTEKENKQVDDLVTRMEKFYSKYFPNKPRNEWSLLEIISHPGFE